MASMSTLSPKKKSDHGLIQRVLALHFQSISANKEKLAVRIKDQKTQGKTLFFQHFLKSGRQDLNLRLLPLERNQQHQLSSGENDGFSIGCPNGCPSKSDDCNDWLAHLIAYIVQQLSPEQLKALASLLSDQDH